LPFDIIIKVLETYSLGLSFFNHHKQNLSMHSEKTEEEIYSEKAEELGVSLEYYLMEFV